MLDALPLSENLNTNQLIVTNTNQVLQPIMYEYVSDEDFDNTQGVVSLNVNGARVLNTFTNPTNIQSNGLHEFDVVDSNVNMPILNYKVNVALPIFEPPNDYTAKRIINGQMTTTLDYFVNGDLSNYLYIPKNLPVVLDISAGINIKSCFNGISPNTKGSLINLNYNNTGSTITVNFGTYINIRNFDSYVWRIYYKFNGNSSDFYVTDGSYYFANNLAYEYINFYDENDNFVFALCDRGSDSNIGEMDISKQIFNFVF